MTTPIRTSQVDEKKKEQAFARIRAAKAELGDDLVILGHHYQRDEVIQFADFQGDSYGLSQQAAQADAKYIVFCGVHFMAESAAILSREDQRVLLPDMKAGCSMAEMATLDEVNAAWSSLGKSLGTDPAGTITPITYMNSAADLKAFVGREGGTVCTSSNARGALEWAFSKREKVFFFPDQHLGSNVGKAMGIPPGEMVLWNPRYPDGGLAKEQIAQAKIILWNGFCCVHQEFEVSYIENLRKEHPAINVIVHPECAMPVVDAADISGSTAQIIRAIEAAEPGSEWAIGTEVNLVKRLKQNHPDKFITLASPYESCAWCVDMARITVHNLADVLDALTEGRVINEVTVPDAVARDARLALERMLAIPK